MDRIRYATAFLLTILLAAAAVPPLEAEELREDETARNYGKLGRLVLPDRLDVRWNGDTLLATDTSAAELTVRVRQLGDEALLDPVETLRRRAEALGIPTYVRAVSEHQRDLAGIHWGGFVLGTVPASSPNALLEGTSRAREDRQKGKRPEKQDLASEEAVETTAQEEPEEGAEGAKEVFPQPDGLPAWQYVSVLYTLKKQAFLLEMSVRLPEGSSMELNRIQRLWEPGK
jgi:hypothetical protein